MSEMKLPFKIDGLFNGEKWDEGIVYEKNGRFYLQWEGLGITRRIRKARAEELYNSDLRIKEEQHD